MLQLRTLEGSTESPPREKGRLCPSGTSLLPQPLEIATGVALSGVRQHSAAGCHNQVIPGRVYLTPRTSWTAQRTGICRHCAIPGHFRRARGLSLPWGMPKHILSSASGKRQRAKPAPAKARVVVPIVRTLARHPLDAFCPARGVCGCWRISVLEC